MNHDEIEKRMMAAGIPAPGQDVILELVSGRRVFGQFKGLDIFEGQRIILVDRSGYLLSDLHHLDVIEKTIKVI